MRWARCFEKVYENSEREAGKTAKNSKLELYFRYQNNFLNRWLGFGGPGDSATLRAAASQRELTMRLTEAKESHKEGVVRCTGKSSLRNHFAETQKVRFSRIISKNLKRECLQHLIFRR